MRHHSVSSPFITIAIVNHSGINMSYVLVMKFAMLPGLVVQNYAFTRPGNDCVNDGSSAYYGHGGAAEGGRGLTGQPLPVKKIGTDTLSLSQGRALLRPLLPRTVGAQGEFADTSSIADEQHRIQIAWTINISGKR